MPPQHEHEAEPVTAADVQRRMRDIERNSRATAASISAEDMGHARVATALSSLLGDLADRAGVAADRLETVVNTTPSDGPSHGDESPAETR
ncbi:hypothetical protein [Actinopolyspora halophila]|uniref:hypothetical protein n=1 Tax=Actinopolyspora halophila TaxID=1850 RepID=UPI000368DC5D|nr:hypothetical protein [Actinopolyspora halophila]